MSLKYISECYGVPADKGQRIVFNGGCCPSPGEIVGAYNASIEVILDNTPGKTLLFHPTWNMEYVESEEL